jgi:Ubiquitin-like modifier-activating enzyme ATG7 N-terminus
MTTSSSSTSSASPSSLKFSSFNSQVDPSFWFSLSTHKLNSWKLDASPQHTYASYSTPVRASSSGDGTLDLNNAAFDISMYILSFLLTIAFQMDMLSQRDGHVISTQNKIGEINVYQQLNN